MSNSLKVIGKRAFYEIRSLMFVNCPQLSIVLEESFYSCVALRKFNARLEKIGVEAFYGCVSLIKINLEKVFELGERAFSYCQSI